MKSYIKIDGIDGEVQDDSHEKWINVAEFHHGIRQESFGNTSGRAGHGAGVADAQEFVVTKEVDSSTPNLNAYCAQNKPIDSVTLHMVDMADGDAKVTYEILMNKCRISSVQIAGSGSKNSPVPMETIAMTFSQIQWTYTPKDDSANDGGAVVAKHDFKKNA